MMSVFAAAAALQVLVSADPGSSATGAVVHVGAQTASVSRDGRAQLQLAPGTYDIVVDKPGFVSAHAHVVVTISPTSVRVALHAIPSATALRTIGSATAAQRGAFNRDPSPVDVLTREGYRDQGQPNTDAVLSQTPSIAIDRAGRGLSANDAPAVPLVRGGLPSETQVLIDGMPVALATTRTLPLSAISAFVTQDIEVHPGSSALLPTIDGAVNGTLNIRLAEPTPVWRALPEIGFDGRGGSFADIAAGGASRDRKLGVALVASTSGVPGDIASSDALQRALLLKARYALSPAASITATRYSESDADGVGTNRFDFTSADYRLTGTAGAFSARAWRVDAARAGAAAGDPIETSTSDTLVGASVQFDKPRGDDLFSIGATATYGSGTANGGFVLAPGANMRIETGFVRALFHPSPRWETQAALYAVGANGFADSFSVVQSGIGVRLGAAYRPSDHTTLRASLGSGFSPLSLIQIAASNGRPFGGPGSATADIGIEQRIFDGQTIFSADAFTATIANRLVENGTSWIDVGDVDRTGFEISFARRPQSGFGFLLQGWTVAEAPASLIPLLSTTGDAASGSTHGYFEVSYHASGGSRLSFGGTYFGADPTQRQPAALQFNSNLEVQVGARGKIQLDVENLNNAPLAVRQGRFFLPVRNAFTPGPRTVRLLLRRSVGRAGTDG